LFLRIGLISIDDSCCGDRVWQEAWLMSVGAQNFVPLRSLTIHRKFVILLQN